MKIELDNPIYSVYAAMKIYRPQMIPGTLYLLEDCIYFQARGLLKNSEIKSTFYYRNIKKLQFGFSVNPFRIEGQKTGAFEIVEQLEEAPDVLAIPVGNAGNITAYWKGFKEYHEKKGSQLPQLFGFQAEGASPIVQNKVIKNPETIATAIRIGNPASWKKATVALEESNGLIDSVTDDEILEAYQLMTSKEGVFSEPASNASIAGLIKLQRAGKLPKGKKVVAILTGNGLKDPDTAISILDNPIQPLPNNKESIINYIKGTL